MRRICIVQVQPRRPVLDDAGYIYIRLPPGNMSYIIQIIQIIQTIQIIPIRNTFALPGTSGP